ncbi:WhiB family transcriptional regulator, redox-sensing transcriptional regulator [Allokutzneria albata]|uniref:Transcriptional regulator WhiB n=1 Tax=Allokutzneria albata TaxID=211114 RepID=A0A1G9YEH3_ALLAB|nr:WhiB family transcriptional regulator, redox-sensing transcriptional regulator [Allokutzneria albata]
MLTATVPPCGTISEVGTVPDYGTADVFDAASNLPCRVGDADLWFAETPSDLDRAKSLCVACPVRAECLAGALARREPWGVWGGEIFERGAVIARKRPRGRPRKETTVGASGVTAKQEAAA